MKKIISFLLAAVMRLSMFGTVFAAILIRMMDGTKRVNAPEELGK